MKLNKHGIQIKEKDKQSTLFEKQEWWEEHWQDMPEYISENENPYTSLLVHFKNRKDMEDFANLVGQVIYKTTQSIWYPKAIIKKSTKRYVTSGYNK